MLKSFMYKMSSSHTNFYTPCHKICGVPDRIEKMGGARGIQHVWGRGEMFWWGKLRERDRLEEPNVKGKIF